MSYCRRRTLGGTLAVFLLPVLLAGCRFPHGIQPKTALVSSAAGTGVLSVSEITRIAHSPLFLADDRRVRPYASISR